MDLPDILHVDEAARTVTAEPAVTIGQLNDYLIERGWTLPVVPEIDDLTIGNDCDGDGGDCDDDGGDDVLIAREQGGADSDGRACRHSRTAQRLPTSRGAGRCP